MREGRREVPNGADPQQELRYIRRRVRGRLPQTVALRDEPARAAVAMILEARADDLYLFFIHRAVDRRDRWSGQMAFPGGFQDPIDPDLLATVHREVVEEVAIDLTRSAEYFGPLDEIQGVARGRDLSLVIRPYVFALREVVTAVPNEEVQSVLWVPLSYLRDPANETVIEYPDAGASARLPAFVFQGRTIWGLTLRMVKNMVAVLAE